jgi:type IV pilus assembly protein PilX
MPRAVHTPKKQRGALLITVLIILLLMTVLAVSGVGNSVLEQKMSGNYYHSITAFEAAEYGMRVAEEWLDSTLTGPADLAWFTTNNAISGLYTTQDASAVNSVEVCGSDINCRFDPRNESEWCAGGGGCVLPKGFVTLGDTLQGVTLSTYAMPVARQPQFIVEYLGQAGGATDVELTPGGAPTADPQSAFRITVIGWGHEGVSKYVLQSHFIKTL